MRPLVVTDAVWAQWPEDRPRPTPEELEAARERYRASLDPADTTDWCCGLEFVMATYARWAWWGLFFPDEKMEMSL